MDTDEVSASQEFIIVNPIETLAGDDESTSVSPQLINRLRDAGYHSLRSIVVLGAQQISNDIQISLESSQRICSLASTKLRNSARTIEDSSSNCLKTGSKVLDHLLGGGIEMGALTEFFGRSASGKTQLCHTISVMSQISPRIRNNERILCKVIYVDTEGTFRPQRVEEIVRARGLKSGDITKNIILLDCCDVAEQERYVKHICELLDKGNSRSLIIIDSIIVHFRAEYRGRSMLPERQHRLNKYLSTLSKIARIYNVAVVMTNQVQSIPSGTAYSHQDDISTGGNILNHISTHRIRLNKSGFGKIYATIVKSPYHSSSVPDARFTITTKGIDDLEDELNMLFPPNQCTTSVKRPFTLN